MFSGRAIYVLGLLQLTVQIRGADSRIHYRDTIERDGQFVDGLDALKQIREDLPHVATDRLGASRTHDRPGALPQVAVVGSGSAARRTAPRTPTFVATYWSIREPSPRM
jgi:hypothetical protein